MVSDSVADSVAATVFATLEADLSCARAIDSIDAFAIERQLSRMYKKYNPLGSKNTDADSAALKKFLAINTHVPSISIDLRDHKGEMRDWIYRVLERHTFLSTEFLCERHGVEMNAVPGISFDAALVLRCWSIGPGSNVDADGSHFVRKMRFGMSVSNECTDYLRELAYVSPALFAHRNGLTGDGVSKVIGSKTLCVPKTPEISRVIAVEPTLNMCCQLAAGNFIAGALRRVGLNIQTQQSKNRALAQVGSAVGDGLGSRLATIDLESASDLISPQLCKELLPKQWFSFLMRIRSEYTSVKGLGNCKINSMSTMGNGFTFALMTLILAAAVYALSRNLLGESRYIDWRYAGVYGDDIIVRKELYAPLCDLLNGMGLRVNSEKSFSEGYFRESCGGDYFCGHDVTPFYIKDLTTSQGRIIAINQIISWSAKRKLNVYRTLVELVKSLNPKYRNAVPMWEMDDAGIKTPHSSPTYRAARWKRVSTVFPSDSDPLFKLAAAVGGFIDGESVSTLELEGSRSVASEQAFVALRRSRNASAFESSFLEREAQSKHYIEKCHTSTVWSGVGPSLGPQGWIEQVVKGLTA